MMKKLIQIFILLSIGLSQSAFPGLGSWYYTSSVASAGGAGAISGAESDRINPASLMELPKQIQLSLIAYPAGIKAQGLLFVKPFSSSTISVNLRHLDYGDFVKIDENGVENGNYSAGAIWLNTTYAKPFRTTNLTWGLSGGLFNSRLETYNTTAMIFNTGLLYTFPSNDTKVGVSTRNIGVILNRYTDKHEKLPTIFTISTSKTLSHLPLVLSADIDYHRHDELLTGRIGGIFQLPYNFKFSFGVNSENLTQRTDYNFMKDILGSTGVGLSFTHKKFTIELGSYFYGTGGWIFGTNLGVEY